YIPIDAQIKNGALLLDESMMTGESVPVNKSEKQEVFAGTLILRGNAVLMVLKKSNNTVLQNIIYTIKQAQMNKPNIQRLSDKVSAWFVPLVLGISVLTFLLNYFAFDIDFSHSIMRCIAVLVIACPCAMGLATPTAIAAGVGKAARKGILLKGGAVLEHFSNIKTLALDKTGTLTNGDFVINDLRCSQGTTEAEAYRLIASLEKTSSHPIATSLLHQLKDYGPLIKWTTSKESNGLGIEGTDEKGDVYKFGSAAFALDTPSDDERLYLSKNSRQLASLFLADGMKENVKQSIDYFKKEGIQVKLISGDSEMRCKQIAYEAGIEEYHWRKLPMQKLEMLQQTKASGLVAMAGDGINDAPSLATADVGISFQSGSGIAQNSASIVLMNEHNFQSLAEAHIISKNTVKTIKQNLFWAFFYNVVAIPMAAIGYLSPIMAAFSMAFSDVVIIANSIRFYHKKS
ncbi:MAG TPA: cation-translocating P-type ATPase, partial [Bacteroidia bacterium]|nr:cation-translocating P-type ATPase [Bacteroidia bacterium]